jgi:hypothetical protein
MTKSRKSIIKTVSKTSRQVLPVVDDGLKKVGTAAKYVATTSVPIVEKGVSAVYGTMATGFDLGVKGVSRIARGVTKRNRSTRSRKGGRSRKLKSTRRRSRH